MNDAHARFSLVHIREFRERRGGVGAGNLDIAQCFGVSLRVRRHEHGNVGKALPISNLGHHLALKGAFDGVGGVGAGEAMECELLRVKMRLQGGRARLACNLHVGCSGHTVQCCRDIPRDVIEDVQIWSINADRNGGRFSRQ